MEEYELQFKKNEKNLMIDGVQAKYTAEVFDCIAKELDTNRKAVYMAFVRYQIKITKKNTHKSSARVIGSLEENEDQSDEEFTVFDDKFKIGRND